MGAPGMLGDMWGRERRKWVRCYGAGCLHRKRGRVRAVVASVLLAGVSGAAGYLLAWVAL